MKQFNFLLVKNLCSFLLQIFIFWRSVLVIIPFFVQNDVIAKRNAKGLKVVAKFNQTLKKLLKVYHQQNFFVQ